MVSVQDAAPVLLALDLLMTKLKIALIFLVLTGCVGSPVKDMTHYDLRDFRAENVCDRNSQCKSILWGVGDCGNYPYGAAGYFIYSTKIGPKNISYLKRLARQSLPKAAHHISNFGSDYELAECTLTLRRKPALICKDNTCQEKSW